MMLDTIKSYLYGAGAALMGALAIALWWYRRQAEKQREKAERAAQKAEAVQARREAERTIERARSKARKEAESHAETLRQDQSRGDRRHGLSNDRLRDD